MVYQQLLKIFSSVIFSSGVDVPQHHHLHEPVLTHSYCQGIGSSPLLGETIGQRLDKVTELYPDRECVIFVDDNERSTYADFREEVCLIIVIIRF